MKLIDLCSYTKRQSDSDDGIYPQFCSAADLSAEEIVAEVKNGRQ